MYNMNTTIESHSIKRMFFLKKMGFLKLAYLFFKASLFVIQTFKCIFSNYIIIKGQLFPNHVHSYVSMSNQKWEGTYRPKK